ILARAIWLPDLTACMDLQASLPAGWIAVPRDGTAIVSDLSVQLRPDDRMLERRAELDRLTAETAKAAAERDDAAKAAIATEGRRSNRPRRNTDRRCGGRIRGAGRARGGAPGRAGRASQRARRGNGVRCRCGPPPRGPPQRGCRRPNAPRRRGTGGRDSPTGP